MDCGVGEWACQPLVTIGTWLNWGMLQLWRLYEIIQPHLQNIFALASGAFAAWKWYQARESVVFRRLSKILNEEESRLRHARADLMRIVHRPAPGVTVQQPRYALPAIKQLLKKRRWNSVFGVTDTVTATDRKLKRVVQKLQDQEKLLTERLAQFRQQRATAFLMQGAIASARAAHVIPSPKAREFNATAVERYRFALDIPGNDADLDALEHLGCQLRQLQEPEEAWSVFDKLEAAIAAIKPSKQRDVMLARAKRNKAQIEGQDTRTNAMNALDAAIAILAQHQPLSGHDLLELAYVNEALASVRSSLNNTVQRFAALDSAERCYQRLFAETDPRQFTFWKRLWLRLKKMDRSKVTIPLHRAATEGLDRVSTTRMTWSGALPARTQTTPATPSA
jgi:tetratricopeptide (TPR) repeat protein